MAINSNFIQRPSDRNLFLIAGIGFPLIVLLGFYKSYIFRAFFDLPPIPNMLVHIHGLVMMAWVVYFTIQVFLIRTKNIKLHMTMGMTGIALAALVIIVGIATAYNSHIVRHTGPPGIDPHKFLVIPAFDMFLFALFFGGAIYYRKRPTEHKSLMLMTAVNFLGSPVSRLSVVPEQFMIFWAFGIPILIAIGFLVWHTVKHRKLNKIFAIAVALFTISIPGRIMLSETDIWLRFANWLAS